MSQLLGSSFFGAALEGFNGTHVGTYEGYVDLQEASLESTMVVEGAYASLFVVEAAVNRQISTGYATMESAQYTLEAAGGGVLSRIKQAFVRLLEKIKGWIKNIRRQFDIQTKKGAEFVTKFKSEIEKKSPSGFKYSGYDWKLSTGDAFCSKTTLALTEKIEDIISGAKTRAEKNALVLARANDENSGLEDKADADVISDKLSTRKSELLKPVGDISELSEVAGEIEKQFRGDNGKNEIEAFAKVNRSAMMDYIKDNKKKIEGIETNAGKQEKSIRKVIEAIDKAETQYNKDNASGTPNSNITGIMSQMSKDAQFAINIITSITSTQKSMHSAAASEFEGALKSFLRYKNSKSTLESTGGNYDPIQSVIESTISSFTL